MGTALWILVAAAAAVVSVLHARARALGAEVSAAWRQLDALRVGRHALANALAAERPESTLAAASEAAELARGTPVQVVAAEAALDAALGAVEPGRYAGAIEDVSVRIAATQRLHAHLDARFRRARRWAPWV